MLGILVSCLAGVVAVDLLHWYGDEMASVHILDKKDVRWQFGYLSESHHFLPNGACGTRIHTIHTKHQKNEDCYERVYLFKKNK